MRSSGKLDERADLFIERAWRHFGSRKYRSTFEILLYFAGSAGIELPDPKRSTLL